MTILINQDDKSRFAYLNEIDIDQKTRERLQDFQASNALDLLRKFNQHSESILSDLLGAEIYKNVRKNLEAQLTVEQAIKLQEQPNYFNPGSSRYPQLGERVDTIGPEKRIERSLDSLDVNYLTRLYLRTMNNALSANNVNEIGLLHALKSEPEASIKYLAGDEPTYIKVVAGLEARLSPDEKTKLAALLEKGLPVKFFEKFGDVFSQGIIDENNLERWKKAEIELHINHLQNQLTDSAHPKFADTNQPQYIN